MAISKTDRFLLDGYNVACALRSFSPSSTIEEIDATVLCNTYRQYESGFKSATLSAEGKFANDSVNLDEIHDILADAFTDQQAKVITAGIGFFAVGGDVIMMDACTTKYDIPMPIGGLIMSNASMRSTNGMAFGKWLISSQLNSGTTTGTVVDGGAATTNGGLFHVHLNNATASDVDTKIQHSTTGVGSWVDLAAVNNLSAIFESGTAVVAKGTTVNRYLRVISVVTGGNTVLLSAAFARRY